MPISDQEGYDTNHFTEVYNYIIKPAIIDAGFDPFRADDTKGTNFIQAEIIQKTIESDLVVCDLSSKNANVMFELGLRQAFDKPAVLLKDNRTGRVFDIEGLRYTEYNYTGKHTEVLVMKEEIQRAITETWSQKDSPSTHNSLIRLLAIEKALGIDVPSISDIPEMFKALTSGMDGLLNLLGLTPAISERLLRLVDEYEKDLKEDVISYTKCPPSGLWPFDVLFDRYRRLESHFNRVIQLKLIAAELILDKAKKANIKELARLDDMSLISCSPVPAPELLCAEDHLRPKNSPFVQEKG